VFNLEDASLQERGGIFIYLFIYFCGGLEDCFPFCIYYKFSLHV
jgi:hypothetical protein